MVFRASSAKTMFERSATLYFKVHLNLSDLKVLMGIDFHKVGPSLFYNALYESWNTPCIAAKFWKPISCFKTRFIPNKQVLFEQK